MCSRLKYKDSQCKTIVYPINNNQSTTCDSKTLSEYNLPSSYNTFLSNNPALKGCQALGIACSVLFKENVEQCVAVNSFMPLDNNHAELTPSQVYKKYGQYDAQGTQYCLWESDAKIAKVRRTTPEKGVCNVKPGDQGGTTCDTFTSSSECEHNISLSFDSYLRISLIH